MAPTLERLAAIRRALEHPQFYDGDIGADIRWLLRCVEQWVPRNQEEVAMTGYFLDRITALKLENQNLREVAQMVVNSLSDVESVGWSRAVDPKRWAAQVAEPLREAIAKARA